MSPEEIRELWSRFLSGATLSAREQKNLVEALDADSELRDSLIENLQLDGMLRALDTTRRHGEAFVRTMTECVGAEHDATRFIEKVELRLNENEPPPPTEAAGTGRRTKPPTTRVFRRRAAVSGQGETAWKPALIAAAALVVILLLVTNPKPATHVAKVAPKPAPEVPFVPVPEKDPAPPAPKDPPRPEAPRNNAEPQTAPLAPRTFVKPEDPPKTTPPSEERPPSVPDAPRPKTEPAPTTVPTPVIVQTKVEKFEGTVFLAYSPANKKRAKKDDPVPLGVAVETYPSSSAFLRFDDNTWVDVGANSSFKELQGAGAPGGRRVLLSHGTLESHIEKQPKDRPMIFETANAEVTIVGTTVRLTVTHDQKGTLLEVKEGKVIFTRLLDRKPVEVVTGQFVVAAAGQELKPQKHFPDDIIVKFGPADLQKKQGWVIDSGAPFDAARGFGWDGSKDGQPMPGAFWKDGQGVTHQKLYGRGANRRATAPDVDPLRQSDVNAGWAGFAETWYMPVPNGKYLVSVCCGDVTYEQGPHHVWVEGVQLIDLRKNRAGESIEVKDVPVEVRDGELTMKVGGYAGTKVSADRSSDTIINYLRIKRIR